MDILLINPPYVTKKELFERFQKDESLIRKGNMYVAPFEPPLGLASLVSVLRKKEFKVELLDLQAVKMETEEIERYLLVRKPAYVGLSAMTTTYPSAVKMARMVKKTLPSCRIVIGGVHPTVMPKEVLEEGCFDSLIRGEGEESLPVLLRGDSQQEIPGVGFKNNANHHIPDIAPLIKDVDSIPMPDYNSFPVEEYAKYNQWLRSLKSISMLISRGCPFDCSFCAVNQTMGRGYRIRNPRLVVSEMKKLKENYGLEGIWFKDSIFNLNGKWVDTFCEEIIKTGLDMKWQINTHVDLVDENQVARMAEAGLIQIDLGIESGSPSTLKKLKKEIGVDRIKSAVKTVKRYAKVAGFFMIGVPGETEEDIEKTFNLARELKLDKTSWSIFTPLPGSNLHDELKKAGSLPERMEGRYLHFTDSPISFSKVPHEKLMKRFWEIQNYFT